MSARWEVVGGGVVAALERMLAAERVPHALLLSGPPQVGKGAIARALAQALNCEGQERPCGECRSCRRIAEGKHADVEVVGPGAICRESDHDHSRSRVIGICAVRRLESVAALQPFEGRQRVFIVDPADALTDEAEDAFLKTLEEPPPAVTFVLVSARPALLRATVRSRCRQLTVSPLPVSELAEWLVREQDLSEDAAGILARQARGRIRWVREALREGDPLETRRAQAHEVRRLVDASQADRLSYAQSLAGGGGEPVSALTALEHWIAWWRDLLLARAACGEQVTHQDQREELEVECRRFRAPDIVRFMRALVETQTHLRHGVNPRLALEALALRIPAATEPAATTGK